MYDSLSNNSGLTIMIMRTKLQTTLQQMQNIHNIQYDDLKTLHNNYTTLEDLSQKHAHIDKLRANLHNINESNKSITKRIQQNLDLISKGLTQAQKSMTELESITIPQKPLIDIASNVRRQSSENLNKVSLTRRNISSQITPLTPALHPINAEFPSSDDITTSITRTPSENFVD